MPPRPGQTPHGAGLGRRAPLQLLAAVSRHARPRARPEDVLVSTWILGISAYYHDSAAALVRDGEVVAAAQEERFTRKKHDAGFPRNAVDYCLREGGISVRDLSHVGFYDKPLLKFGRLLETYVGFAPRGLRSWLAAMPTWLKDKLWIGDHIATSLGWEGEVIYGQHHLSHAASAFFPSPYREAAILTVDGVGEWTTASRGLGSGNRVEIRDEVRFPHSLGLLYSAFTAFTGFKVNSGEYKLMGLAPYGEPRYVDLIYRELLEVAEDGSFRLNMDYFDFATGLRMTNRRFERLFGGPPRRPETPITQREMDMARSIQVVTEDAMLRMARSLHQEVGARHLCLAGGVALNCVANGRILREGPFEGVWIQPAAGDAGGALGVALYVWHQHLGNPREADGVHDRQRGSYLGPAFGADEIRRFLDAQGAVYEEVPPGELPGRVADCMVAGKVVGLLQGRMEFGPRALGARSIIGDARSAEMQRLMNVKIKFRESFRPFAPSVLREHVHEWFEMDCESPYMLLVADVRQEHRVAHAHAGLAGLDKLKAVRSTVPAITHVDYSARVQTVDREVAPRYHAIIEAFRARTGCPVIINTSFNVRGEPIVCTPADAWRCFLRTNMDVLIIEDFLIDKVRQNVQPPDESWKEEFPLD
ncbi:MAG: carbamoyltransferase [Planctomycetes bacterium]|nr:carbamoyltransferase [Planctomycetota bacterium]